MTCIVSVHDVSGTTCHDVSWKPNCNVCNLPPRHALDRAARAGTILHHMVKFQGSQLDRTFAALVDPTRRAILARLALEDSVSIGELARPFAIKLPAVMKHLDVLGTAGLDHPFEDGPHRRGAPRARTHGRGDGLAAPL